jgi:tRNA 2-thiouridine synthesizing protein E
MNADFKPSPARGVSLPHWDVKVAVDLAKKYGITLTVLHFEILGLARSFFFEYGFSPSSRPLAKYISCKKGLEKSRSIYLLSLFPQKPALLIAEIAGLPKPKNCL